MPDPVPGRSPTRFLLTGIPGCGKTYMLEAVLEQLPIPSGGFLTREVRSRGARVGFEMVSLQDGSCLLAQQEFPGPSRVARFGVDVGAVHSLAVPAVQQAMNSNTLVVIDEIGPMEMFSTMS
jgi:nucleoside-triphosphatase